MNVTWYQTQWAFDNRQKRQFSDIQTWSLATLRSLSCLVVHCERLHDGIDCSRGTIWPLGWIRSITAFKLKVYDFVTYLGLTPSLSLKECRSFPVFVQIIRSIGAMCPVPIILIYGVGLVRHPLFVCIVREMPSPWFPAAANRSTAYHGTVDISQDSRMLIVDTPKLPGDGYIGWLLLICFLSVFLICFHFCLRNRWSWWLANSFYMIRKAYSCSDQ